MKKMVFPGDHLGSCEEFVSGQNTYCEDNEIYSSSFGEVIEKDRKISVSVKRKITRPKEGVEVYGIVSNMSDKVAFIDCTKTESGAKDIILEDSLILSVNNASKGFVKSLKDAVRIGDIVKAQIIKGREEEELSLAGPNYGVVRAYCTRCRNSMVLKNNRLKCSKCGHIENRKISKDYSG